MKQLYARIRICCTQVFSTLSVSHVAWIMLGETSTQLNVDAMAKCIAPENRRRQRELTENAKQCPVLLEEVQSP